MARALVVGVVGGLDVLHEVDRQPARDARAPDGRGGHPPRRHLDRVDVRERVAERVVVLEAAHRHVQLEPLRRLAERVERDVVPARGEPVEVLEDVAVSAADARVLGHVDDPQRLSRGGAGARELRAPPRVADARLARVEEVAPALPEALLRLALALAELGAARDRLVVDELRAREVQDAQPGDPRAQAPVDVLVGHRVALVEGADALDRRAAHVHAGAGHREAGLARRPGPSRRT